MSQISSGSWASSSFSFSPFLLNLLGVTLVTKSHRFQVHESTAHHLYTVLCVHHPKSSLHPSPFSPLHPHLSSSTPHSLAIPTLFCVHEVFLFFSVLAFPQPPLPTAVNLLSSQNTDSKEYMHPATSLTISKSGK